MYIFLEKLLLTLLIGIDQIFVNKYQGKLRKGNLREAHRAIIMSITVIEVTLHQAISPRY